MASYEPVNSEVWFLLHQLISWALLALTSQALQKKLDLLKREESLIKEELARAAIATSASAAAAAIVQTHASDTSAVAAAPAATSSAAAVAAKVLSVTEQMSVEEAVIEAAEEKQRRLRKAVQALIDLVTTSGVAKERATFMNLVKVRARNAFPRSPGQNMIAWEAVHYDARFRLSDDRLRLIVSMRTLSRTPSRQETLHFQIVALRSRRRPPLTMTHRTRSLSVLTTE
jgi:hypothetical protein